MTLWQHAGDYDIELDGQGLMSTRAPGSERALADLAAQALTDKAQPRVLIGGLGLGFTLGAVLDVLPPGASVVVVEFFETIVDWNRKFSFESATDRLADPRVIVEVTDVVDYLRKLTQPFDAIVLDVDNGPEGLVRRDNDWLYGPAGLRAARAALRPRGVVAVWSASPDRAFSARLRAAGFDVAEHGVRPHRAGKGPRHRVWIGAT